MAGSHRRSRRSCAADSGSVKEWVRSPSKRGPLYHEVDRGVQAACIGSGSAGTGVLCVRGKQYPFDVGGTGAGGIGLSTIDASGEVYNLCELAQFRYLDERR